MRNRTKLIFRIYIWAVLAGIAVGFVSVNIGRWMGRLYAVDNDHDINVLVLLSFQAAIAIDMLDRYHQENDAYPDEIESLNIDDYPDYVVDTFLSQYENHRFPRFVYSKQRGSGSETSVEYFTITAHLGVDKLVYDSRQEEWRFFQRRLGSDGYLVPGGFKDVVSHTWPPAGDRSASETAGHDHELAIALHNREHDAMPGTLVAGENWTSPTTGMEFVWIPQMNMWVGKHEVTNAEYRMKEPGHNSGEFEGHTLNLDRQPVVHVIFDEFFAYASWMSDRDQSTGLLPSGYRYRLPSDQEWMTFAQCGDHRCRRRSENA